MTGLAELTEQVTAALGRSVQFSTASSTAPPHSPPTARPCSTRSTTSSAGAATPIDA